MNLEPLACQLGMDLYLLRNRIEAQFTDHDMFWGNYIWNWEINKDLKPVWIKGWPPVRTKPRHIGQ